MAANKLLEIISKNDLANSYLQLCNTKTLNC